MIDSHIQAISRDFIDLATSADEPLLYQSFNTNKSLVSLQGHTFSSVLSDLDIINHQSWKFFVYGFSAVSNRLNRIQNRELLSLASPSHCSVYKVAAINPCAISLKELSSLSANFVGFHFKPNWVNFELNDNANKTFLFLQDSGKPLFLHMDYVYALKPLLSDPRDFINNLVSNYPRLRIVLEHCGGGVFLAELFEPYKSKLNNVCYSTAVPGSPMLSKILCQCVSGAKVVFGSDYPFCGSLFPYEFYQQLISLGANLSDPYSTTFSSWFDL